MPSGVRVSMSAPAPGLECEVILVAAVPVVVAVDGFPDFGAAGADVDVPVLPVEVFGGARFEEGVPEVWGQRVVGEGKVERDYSSRASKYEPLIEGVGLLLLYETWWVFGQRHV